jgi:hypothetical protein
MDVLFGPLFDFHLFSQTSIIKLIQHWGLMPGFIYSAVKGLKRHLESIKSVLFPHVSLINDLGLLSCFWTAITLQPKHAWIILSTIITNFQSSLYLPNNYISWCTCISSNKEQFPLESGSLLQMGFMYSHFQFIVVFNRVPGYRSTGPGFDSQCYQIF